MVDPAFMSMIENNTWNVLMFYQNETEECIEAMDLDLDLPSSANSVVPFPPDSIRCHVILVYSRKGEITVDEPFVSHFTSPIDYVRHIVGSGFSGFMIKDNHEHIGPVVTMCHNALVRNVAAEMLKKALDKRK